MHRTDYFGLRVAEERREKGWTQGELARRAGASEDAVQNWEQGRALPSLRDAVDLAALLGVNLDGLLSPPASMERPKPGRPRKAPSEG